jgi:glycosyltransferase involved in cell wall biosynthesis
MKILYVSPYPPARDGIGSYTHAMAGLAQDAGHDIGVIVPGLIRGSPAEVLGGLGWRPGHLAGLGDTVTAWGPDVVHVQFAVAAFGARTPLLVRWLTLLRRQLPVPVVITMHEVTRDTALLRGPGRALYRLLAGHADRIIVHTGAARDALTRMGGPPGKTVIIPHPRARPPRAESTPAGLRARFGLGDSRILLAFGYVHIDKGLGDLVRALGILSRSAAIPLFSPPPRFAPTPSLPSPPPAPGLRDVRLVIAGAVRPRRGVFRVFEARDRAHLARVLRQARRSGLGGHLVLTGYVPDGDVEAWFRAAEAAVLPYRRIEQSGVAGLAGAFGVPVLASTAGGLGELYAGSRWTFPPRRPDRLAQVLADFLRAAPAEREIAAGHRGAPDLQAVTELTLSLYRAGAQGPAVGVPRAG